MRYNGYIHDALASLEEYRSSIPQDRFFEAPDSWEEDDAERDMRRIRNQKITAGDFTEVIRSGDPGYSGPAAKNWSGADARKAIRDAAAAYRLENSAVGRQIWPTTLTEEQIRQDETAQESNNMIYYRRVADRFMVGDALGMYYRLVYGSNGFLRENLLFRRNEGETEEAYETRKKDAYEQTHIALLEDIKDKVENDDLIGEMLEADSKKLIDNWKTYFAVLQMADLGPQLKLYPDDEDMQKKLKEYDGILARLRAVRPEIEARMNLLASDYADKIDVDKVMEMTPAQLDAVQNAVNEKRGVYASLDANNPFKAAQELNKLRLERHKTEIAEKYFQKDEKLLAADINGKAGNVDALLQSGLPVFVSSESKPDQAQLVYRDGALVFYGDAAAERFREKRTAALAGKPTGIGWLWDKFCSAVGRENWRTAAAKNYYKYERMTADYPDIETKLGNLSETTEAARRQRKAQDKPEAQQKTQDKPEVRQDLQKVKEYLNTQLRRRRNSLSMNSFPVNNVGKYLLLKSLSAELARFEKGDAGAIGSLFGTDYQKRIDDYIDKRLNFVSEDKSFTDAVKKLKDDLENDTLTVPEAIESAEKFLGQDAFKLTVPGKTPDEYTRDLFLSANKMDKDLQDKLTELSDRMNNQTKELLEKKEEPSRRDICRSFVRMHIVGEIKEGIESAGKAIGLDPEIQSLANLILAGEDYSKKLDMLIDSRANELDVNANFEVSSKDEEKKTQTVTLGTEELKNVLAAMASGNPPKKEEGFFKSIEYNNQLTDMLSSVDMDQRIEQHMNLKNAGMTEAARIVLEECRKNLSEELDEGMENKDLSATPEQKAHYLSVKESYDGIVQTLDTLSCVENGTKVNPEALEYLKKITGGIMEGKKNNKPFFEKTVRLMETKLKNSEIVARMTPEEFEKAIRGPKNKALTEEFKKIQPDIETEVLSDPNVKAASSEKPEIPSVKLP